MPHFAFDLIVRVDVVKIYGVNVPQFK